MLIVDDCRDAADTLAILIRFWGYDVRVAYEGRAALETARSFRPDCLLLDIGLPGLDGYLIARHLRADPALARVKLIALTAYGSPEDQHRVREAGFDYHLVKPAEPDEIRRYVTVMEQALRLAEKTEALAQQNVELAREAKTLLTDVKEEIKEVKQELREVKEDIKDIKEDAGRARKGKT